jgi:hypothetical protein
MRGHVACMGSNKYIQNCVWKPCENINLKDVGVHMRIILKRPQANGLLRYDLD